MASSQQHPLEGVYHARDALENAVSAQTHTEITRQEWLAYGAVLMAVLRALRNLIEMLLDQVNRMDRDLVAREAVRTHPEQALDRAVEHLLHLGQVLGTAVSDAQRHWAEAQHVYDDTIHREGNM